MLNKRTRSEGARRQETCGGGLERRQDKKNNEKKKNKIKRYRRAEESGAASGGRRVATRSETDHKQNLVLSWNHDGQRGRRRRYRIFSEPPKVTRLLSIFSFRFLRSTTEHRRTQNNPL